MACVDEITRPICFDGDELTLETDAVFSVWRQPDGETYEAFVEPVPLQRGGKLTRDDLCRFWGERRVIAAEDDALEVWLETGPAALRQARAEESARIREEA